MADFKIRSQKPVFHSRSFDILRYEVEKDGNVHTHDNIHITDDVFVVPITADNTVILISQYRYLLGKVILEMPAGVMDAGEDPEAAALRELREETGYTAGKLTKIASLDRGGSFIKGKWHIFVAQELSEGDQEQDEFEDIKVVKLPISEAVKKIETGEIPTTGAVSAILLADRLLSEGKL